MSDLYHHASALIDIGNHVAEQIKAGPEVTADEIAAADHLANHAHQLMLLVTDLCELCEGQGWHYAPYADARCPACSGKGRVPK